MSTGWACDSINCGEDGIKKEWWILRVRNESECSKLVIIREKDNALVIGLPCGGGN